MLRAVSHRAERGARGILLQPNWARCSKIFLTAAKRSQRMRLLRAKRLLRAFSSAPSGPFTPQTPLRVGTSPCSLVAEELTRPALSGLNIVSSFLRLAQVFYSDVPYRVSNVFWDFCISFFFHSLRIFISSGDGTHGRLSLFHRFILTRHFALQVVLRPCGTLSQNGSLHLRIITEGSVFTVTVQLKSIF